MLSAETIAELHSRLLEINIEVPERAAGRTNEHTETYSIVRLLGSVPFDLNDFPLSLGKREKPDFLLTLAQHEIGIEHTEAISENAAKEAFLRSKGHGPEVHYVRAAALHEPRKSSETLIAEIQADKPTPGWYGDSVERSWADAMAYFIAKKVETANKEGFELFQSNWLLIYDNWPGAALGHEKAVVLLREKLDASGPWDTFDRVYVLDERVLIEFSPRVSLFHEVNHCRL